MKDIKLWLSLIFLIYLSTDGFVGVAQAISAYDYWNRTKPTAKFCYTLSPMLNIPVAIYCWVKYGNPLATWKMIEEGNS